MAQKDVEGCRLLDTSPSPVGTGSCPGVRPGALHATPLGECSFNFLFRGSDGHRYIGSAGHCALEDADEKAWASGSGPRVLDTDGKLVGRFAYALLEGPASGADFALVRLLPGVKADPSMCYFGGPTGINDDITSDPVLFHWFGHGGLVGWEPTTRTNTLSARSALASEGMPDPLFVAATGPAFFGDSGSGVISDDGRAVGVATTLLFGKETMGITRLTPQLEQAEDMLGIRLRLVKAEY